MLVEYPLSATPFTTKSPSTTEIDLQTMPNEVETRWRIGLMPYLNSAVFYARLEGDWFDLIELPPRNMAASMQQGELDAGPLPIAEVLRMQGNVVEGSLGVATNGLARSVLLLSDVPAEELSGRTVAVTGHTSTSVQLLRILFADHWTVDDVQLRGPEEECVAELLIGDAALQVVHSSTGRRFVYDLSYEWKRLTGLPFVFARWVARGDATAQELGRFAETLHKSFAYGISHINEIADLKLVPSMSVDDVSTYISGFTYELGETEHAAIDEFQSRLERLPEWRPSVIPYSSDR